MSPPQLRKTHLPLHPLAKHQPGPLRMTSRPLGPLLPPCPLVERPPKAPQTLKYRIPPLSSRWRALHVPLGNLNCEADPQEGHMFFRKLLHEIQLRVRSVNPEFLKIATDALKRATLAWDFLRDEHKAQKRKQARSDKYSSKVPRTDSRKEASDTPQKDSRASRPHHIHRPSSNTSPLSTRPNDKEGKLKETGCYRCGKQGHFARGRPTNIENKEKPRSDRRKSQKHSKSHGRSATT